MAKANKSEQSQYKTNISKPYTGLHNDNNPIDQPKGTHRYALNAVNEAQDGQQANLSNEKGTAVSSQLPEGFYFLGDRYLEDDLSAVICTNPTTGKNQIGFVNKDGIYSTVVDTATLSLSIAHQCDIRYRLRRGKERVIYWVDGFNKARSFNFDRQYEYYNSIFKAYLQGGGDPNTFVGEKWQGSAFDLIKSFKNVPFFTDVSVIEVGAITPGSYNFAIQYVDNDLNPTEWITTSNTVNIYNDTVDTPYYKIRGSRNANNSFQSFEPANKSIRLVLTNMDLDFPFYRVAIIAATGVTGQVVEVFASDIQSTTNGIFIYSGNNASLTKTSLEDILIQNEVLFAPSHIEQIENRLTLAATKGKGVNWCEFQKFASKIKTDLATREVILNSVLSEPNTKNANSTFVYRGYMPGEAYSLAACYLFDDGTLSPAFHIPGPSPLDTSASLLPYLVENSAYENIHNCATNNYWGVDYMGNALVGNQFRHHRFPFRKDIGKPLFIRAGENFIIQRYKLTFTVTLNVGQTWPVDGGGDDLVITYKIIYKIGTTGSNITITRNVISSQEGTSIVIYDDVDALGDVSGTAGTMPISGTIQEVLVTEAGTLSDYVTSGVFSVSGTYTSYDADTVNNVDRSEIFGIQLSNIEKPSENVVGVYILRNERREDDKLIIDNAIFGPMTENAQYKAFGLLMPKQYYPVQTPSSPLGSGCFLVTRNSGKTLNYFNRASWFFNPEYQFFTKKTTFNNINIQGVLTETAVNLPTRKEEYNGTCVAYRGVLIQDVQPGTSYNPSVNKGSDSDGFDMIIGYRNTEINYQDTNTTLPDIERTFYLNSASSQVYNSDVLYNVSCDNKIGITYFDTTFNTDIFYSPTNKRNYLLYGSLVRDNLTAYSNFMSRPYYKEHNNPFLFGGASIINNISVYNGDAYIQPLTLNSSVFYDTVVANRSKKSRVWQIVVGAVLVVVGVVGAIFTAGGTLTLAAVGVAALSAAAISYGISLAVSGFKFEQFKNMIDNDYSKGLKDCVVDGAVYECISDEIARTDDTIRWFADRINSTYIESSVPFAIRDGITAGVVDFLDSPTQFEEDIYRNYLVEKLTTIDRDQGSGRLYKGYATSEFYSMNLDYMRFNKETIISHLPLEYDCCADAEENFSTRIWWSEQSFQEETVDNYRVFLPNNYKDMEGEHGSITDLFRMGNALFVHTKEAVWQLPQNIQERVTSEVVSFIGTGEFFNIPPRKILDDNLGSAGTQHKWASVKSDYGYIFISEIENKVYIVQEKIKEISNEGVRNWFKNNLKSYLSHQFFTNLGIPYANDNNPANPAGVGYIATFDTRHNRYILTKRDYLYLGDFSKIIKDFDPTQNYPIGNIIITDNGFEEIINISFSSQVPITTGDWVPDSIGTIVPSLGVPTSPSNPLILTYGEVYAQSGALIYTANNYADINFGSADHVIDIINVYLNACAQEQIEIFIPKIESLSCSSSLTFSGGVGTEDNAIVLGNKPGVVKFILGTYDAPDGVQIFYGDPVDNILLWSTCQLPTAGSPPNCLVSTNDIDEMPEYQVCGTDPVTPGNPIAIFFNYPATDPDIQYVTVRVISPLIGTLWSFTIGCACMGGLPVTPEEMTSWNYCADCSS